MTNPRNTDAGRSDDILLLRQSYPYRPSLENRVAFQWEAQEDLLGYRNLGIKNQTMLQWLADAVKRAKRPAAVLDVGCAYGNLLLMLNAKLGKPEDVEFVGLDLFPGGIEYARAFAAQVPGNTNCSYEVGDLSKGLPFPDEQFDAVNMGDVLEHMEEPAKAMKELTRVTKPGGAIVIGTPLRGGLFKRVAAVANWISRGRLYKRYYRGKDNTELDERGRPVMVTAAGLDHVSEMSWPELKRLFATAGLRIRAVKMMPVMSGSLWFDRHPFLVSGLLFLEAIHDSLQLPSWAHGVIVELEKATPQLTY